MILRIIILTCALFVSSSLGGMTVNEFSSKFEDMCFQNENTDPFKINGQDNPLSNTLENFIALAEKFEDENPTFQLKDELHYFIRNYLCENIRLTAYGIESGSPSNIDLTDAGNLWEPDDAARDRSLQYNDPFSEAEKCSLYYMISHSIVEYPKAEADGRSNGALNGSSSRSLVILNDLNPEDYYPQEIGVVAINGSMAGVSLSKVLLGLYVGMNQNRMKDLLSFDRVNKGIPQDVLPDLPQEKTLDSLYALTMAEVLMLAGWPADRTGLAENGAWVSSPLGKDIKIEGFCPMVYKQDFNGKKTIPAYSYSSVRGAADGLILGMIVSSLQTKKPNTKLSQILRMYYSRQGIPVEQGNADFHNSRVSFCYREDLVNSLTATLENQMQLYGYLVAQKFKQVKATFTTALDTYRRKKSYIFQNADLENYCRGTSSTSRPEDAPRQTFLDIFVLLDSRTTEELFQQQQLITGHLAKKLDLRVTGSRMTIFLDHRITPRSGTSAKIALEPIVEDTHSSSCAACTIAQIGYENSDIERANVIIAISQLLEERKSNETKHHGVNGKVVVYFNFESEDVPVKDMDLKVTRALREFHLNHPDVLLYAVGLNKELLKQFARNDPSLVFLAGEGTAEEVANKIYHKLSAAPGRLQYTDCKDGRSESSAVYENFASPYAIQHWHMRPEFFYKSKDLKVMFETQNGAIRVCHNRATMTPEYEANNCLNTSSATGQTNSRIEFRIPNPCISLTKETCSPFYFAVMGVTPNGGSSNGPARDYCNDITDHWCNTLDDIKFKVSHEGIRCSGCLELTARPVAILLALFLIYFLQKKF